MYLSKRRCNIMKSNIMAILQQLKISNNEKNENKDLKINRFANIDQQLAASIYNFLNGKSDFLLPYETIDILIDKSVVNKSEIISLGFGIVVDRFLTVEIEEIKDNNDSRFDIISYDSHTAYYIKGNSSDIDKRKYQEIDVNNDSRYDSKRINDLQEYLKNYKREYYGKKSI